MNAQQACNQILEQLANVLHQIDEHDYSRPSEALSKSTIGQHLRHTLEFFICFEHGYHTGVVNYDKRSHDKLIESDKFIALAAIRKISDFLNSIRHDRKLKLEVGYDLVTDTIETVDTNSLRELVYNIEHAVHHMAIMKIGIREVASYITLPLDFGIAASTVRYKEASVKTAQQ